MDFLIWDLFFLDAVWFTLNGNKCQNNKQQCSKNPNAAHRTNLHGLTVRVPCAVSAYKINGPVFFKEIIHNL